jgi:hypothetical protein
MCVRRPLLTSEEQPVSYQPPFLRVGGRYRVGKHFGTGEPHSDDVFLGNGVYDVALKIGHAWNSPLRLSHEYGVYTTISGSAGISEAEYRKYVLGNLSSNQTDVLRVWEVRPMLLDGAMTHTLLGQRN